MKAFRLCIAILVCLLCLAGCQRDETAGENISEEQVSDKETTTLSDIECKTDSFAVARELKEEQSLWPTEYM